MASTPTPEQVRVLLTDPKQAPADLDRLGSLFLEEGRPNIAMMFFERSGSKESLARVLRPAVDGGDTFLVEWVYKIKPELVVPQDWIKTGEAALKAGKFAFARDAFRRAGDDARVLEAQKALDESLSR